MCKNRKRIVPAWQPEWTPELERWTAARIRDNLWRFDTIHTFNDVMQDAKILFIELRNEYRLVRNSSHFFALYKTSLLRRFIDKARLRTRSAIDQDVSIDDTTEDASGYAINSGQISLLLEEMPDELKLVLGSLTSGRIRLKLNKSTTSMRRRENHNMRLKRRLSLSMDDPVGALREYLTINT